MANILYRFYNANKKVAIYQILVKIFKIFPIYPKIRYNLNEKHDQKQLKRWEVNEFGDTPPNKIKQKILLEYAKKYNLKVLVETGTFYGDLINNLKKNFEQIYSIELEPFLYKTAVNRFKNEKHIKIIYGDSANKLKDIMDEIKQPALFWLDGHASGGETARGDKSTPIYEELKIIFGSKDYGHIIIIDDARLFGRDPEYPTMNELKQYILSKKKYVNIDTKFDSIRIIPSKE